ncbi:hypothetical protein JOM56_011779 [Amanita muscaria]
MAFRYTMQDDESYDDPPPQYSRFDENQNSNHQRPQPQPQSRFSYTTNNYSRRPPQTRYTSPPEYPPARPASRVGTADGPPASVQPSNGTFIDRANEGVNGSYIVDPDRSGAAPEQKNLKLSSRNGVIDVDVAVLPVRSTSANASGNTADRATMKFESRCGGVLLRLHDAPKRFLPNNGAGHNFIPRSMTVDVDSKNGNIYFYIPRSYKGILHLQTVNGKVELSSSVRASITTLQSNESIGNSELFGTIGPVDGLQDIQDALAAERVADAAERAEASYSAPNDFSQFLGTGVTMVAMPDGSTSYVSGNGMFNGVSNMTISGGEFHNVGGSEYVVVNGRPVSHSAGPHQSASNFSMTIGTQAPKRKELSPILKALYEDFKRTKSKATSKNGHVKVCYDDETMDEQAGGWKANNEDTPGSGGRRANTLVINSGRGGYARFSGTFTGMGRNFPFVNVGDSTTFSWFG